MIVYIAHRYGGNAVNLVSAREWLYWALVSYPAITPIAPWLTTVDLLDDSNPEHRARGMDVNEVIISRCDQVWLTGPEVSPGMIREALNAMDMGIAVVDFTYWTGPTYAPAPHQTVPGRVWMPEEYWAHKNRLAMERALAAKPQTDPARLLGTGTDGGGK